MSDNDAYSCGMPFESSERTSKILIVDDDIDAGRSLATSLARRDNSFAFALATTEDLALQKALDFEPVIVILDLCLTQEGDPESGIRLLPKLLEILPHARIFVLTGHFDVTSGMRSLQAGASSFLGKPVEIEHLLAVIRDAVSYLALTQKINALFETECRDSQLVSFGSLGLRSRSPLMNKALERAAFAASTLQNVLLVGETGTGKGILAQRIAVAGQKKNGPFIRFQPSYGSFDLISSELFGHERGSFTGATEARKGLVEEAHSGTLFIDEIDELPQQTQVYLLHVLQDRKFRRLGSNREIHSDFRLVSATNRQLESLLRDKILRSDFYHRIAHVVIELPALRDRLEDLRDLVQEFLSTKISGKVRISHLSNQTWSKLMQYNWPGNIRELQSVILNAAHRAHYRGRNRIEVEDLELDTAKTESAMRTDLGVDSGSFRTRVRAFENQLIREAMNRNNNNQSVAAQQLKLDRSSFRRILARE